jgi:hypothetical protein
VPDPVRRDRARVRARDRPGWAIAGAAIFTIYVVASDAPPPRHYPYYEAHGSRSPRFANRKLGWSEGTIEDALVVVCVVALVVVVALKLLRPHSVGFSASPRARRSSSSPGG